MLKKVAIAGASVLFTIHQPSSDIFSTFDYLILLNKGRVMYEGQVTNVPMYFAMKDYPMPPNYNPADWIMVRGFRTACLPCLYSLRFLQCSCAFSGYRGIQQHVAQLQGIKELEDAGFFPKDERPRTEAFKGEEVEGKDALGNTIVEAPDDNGIRDERHVTQITELIWLMRREGNAMKRDKMFLVARFVQATAMSLLVGVIFLHVGEADPAFPSVSA